MRHINALIYPFLNLFIVDEGDQRFLLALSVVFSGFHILIDAFINEYVSEDTLVSEFHIPLGRVYKNATYGIPFFSISYV